MEREDQTLDRIDILGERMTVHALFAIEQSFSRKRSCVAVGLQQAIAEYKIVQWKLDKLAEDTELLQSVQGTEKILEIQTRLCPPS
jgi:hypothetical protein